KFHRGAGEYRVGNAAAVVFRHRNRWFNNPVFSDWHTIHLVVSKGKPRRIRGCLYAPQPLFSGAREKRAMLALRSANCWPICKILRWNCLGEKFADEAQFVRCAAPGFRPVSLYRFATMGFAEGHFSSRQRNVRIRIWQA